MGLRIKPFAYFSFPAWKCIPYGVAMPGHGNQVRTDIKKEIELLREYNIALIGEVVTGKIKVI
jgi:hypothetical protein